MNLIFLHGALGCKKHWQPTIDLLKGQYSIHNLDFPSHGENSDSLDSVSIDKLAAFVENYIITNHLTKCIIIGYSLGGYVALYLAQRNPVYLNKVIVLATKFNWTHEIINQECEKLTVQNLEPIIPKLKLEQSLDIEDFIKITKEIIASIDEFRLKEESLCKINVFIHILIGSIDKMINIEEMDILQKKIPNSQISILENQPHLLQKMDAVILSSKIESLFTK